MLKTHISPTWWVLCVVPLVSQVRDPVFTGIERPSRINDLSTKLRCMMAIWPAISPKLRVLRRSVRGNRPVRLPKSPKTSEVFWYAKSGRSRHLPHGSVASGSHGGVGRESVIGACRQTLTVRARSEPPGFPGRARAVESIWGNTFLAPSPPQSITPGTVTTGLNKWRGWLTPASASIPPIARRNCDSWLGLRTNRANRSGPRPPLR